MEKKDILVLVSDVDSRKGLDVLNMMQRKYKFKCILAAGKDTKIQLPIVYGKKVHLLRNSSFDLFKLDLQSILSRFPNQHIIYMPVAETLTRHLIRFIQEEKVDNLHHILPDQHFFNLCANKGEFQKYCEERNFPVPKSYNQNSIVDLRANFRSVLIKPKSGQGSVGIHYLNSIEDLDKHTPIDFEKNIVQERIVSKNQVAGAFFFCVDGNVISSYCHQRIRTFPEIGGVTVFSKSIRDEQILKIGAELLKSMNWNGLAMIEFMFDEPSQSWRIIELNPRIWGSIMLSAHCEADLLKHYVQFAIDKNNSKPNLTFKEEKFIRWVFPFDFIAFVKRKIGFKELFFRKNACFINFTYSNFWRSLSYMLYFTFNFSSIKRFFKKLAT